MDYNDLYDENYYHNGCGSIPYEEPEHWTKFFGNVADNIIKDFNPKTVLDVGCAMGYLVTALRDRGVQAYGIDVSEYALSKVRDDLKPFCKVASALESLPSDFPERFDLVTTIEVIEHLYEKDSDDFIENICKYSDNIIFTSTPYDHEERTHYNVQEGEYWCKKFAKNSFFRNSLISINYICEWAIHLTKIIEIQNVIFNYEKSIRLDKETIKKSAKLLQYNYGSIYLDFGNGYSEENKVNCEYIKNKNNTQFSVTIPENTVVARFDPCENESCIVRNLKIFLDGIQITDYKNNGLIIKSSVIFNNNDPWFEFEVKSHREIKIEADLFIVCNELTSIILSSIEETNNGNQLKELACNNVELNKKLVITEKSLLNMENKVKKLICNNEELNSKLVIAENNFLAILNSRYWRFTKNLRKVTGFIKRILKSNPITRNIFKGLLSFKRNGIKETHKKVAIKFMQKNAQKHILNNYKLSKTELNKQRQTNFNKNIKFSIIVPLYNTPKDFLIEMIDSVKKQTYRNWELCLADGSNYEFKFVEDICIKYAKNDDRIKYKKLEKNLGISENTNACIDMSTGDYIALFDHDDLLHPAALFENMKVICEKNADFIYSDENTFSRKPKDAYCPHFKPDFSVDTLRSYNYICHFSVFKKLLLNKVGNFRKEFDGSQDYDMVLRLTEEATNIAHIPKIIYYWRAHKNSVAADISAKPYVIDSAKKALSEHLDRIGLKGEVVDARIISTYKINYEIDGTPLVSILIPNKDNINDLDKCIKSIFEKSTYSNYEIIVIENNSINNSTFDYYRSLEIHENVKVVIWKGKFNYSAINNFGFLSAKGDHIIFLNNDIEIICANWIEEMLMYSQRGDVGAVGAKLYYPDNTIQHGGVVLGIGGVGGHVHKYLDKSSYGYMSRLCIAQNFSAVTAACMMVSRHVFEEVGGFDETFEVAFNDVDLCMRIRKAGYNIVWTPYAELYHYESKSRGVEDTPEKQKRFEGEVTRFKSRWKKELEAGDPYYNPNLTLEREDFSIKY